MIGHSSFTVETAAGSRVKWLEKRVEGKSWKSEYHTLQRNLTEKGEMGCPQGRSSVLRNDVMC